MSVIKKIARERNMTAAEAGKRIGRSPRTVRRLVALDRDDYLERAALKRQKAWDMRAVGCSWDEIAKVLETTYGGARSLYYQHVKHLEKTKTHDTATLDMFD